MSKLRLGVVGVGHLGKIHARILASLPEVELVGVADANLSQAQTVAESCKTSAFRAHTELLPLVDAVVVAVPTRYHHAVATDCLERGLSVLVEKPLAADSREAAELVELARSKKVVLQTGHVERFNPAYEELRRRPLRPRYVRAERCSGYSGRSTDIGAVLDLMIHDIDLVLALVGAEVKRVEAFGAALLGGQEDMAQARLWFADGCVADLSATRVHPTPLRRLQAWGAEGYAMADCATRKLTLMQPADHLRQGFDASRLDPAALKTELFTRHVEVREIDCAGGDQLTAELQDFVTCIRTGGTPRVDGAAGRDALLVADCVVESLRTHSWGDGSIGPWQLPAPVGALFPPSRAAA